MLKRSVFAIAIFFGFAGPAFAQTCGSQTLTTFSNGTTADATQVNNNFSCILNSPKFAGPVGIGTASPQAALDVQTSASVMAARFKGSPTSGTNYIRVDSQYGGGYFGSYNNYPAILKDGVNYAYYYNGNINASILAGNVGIGTENPVGAALFVAGPITGDSGAVAYQFTPSNSGLTIWTNTSFSTGAPYSNWSTSAIVTASGVSAASFNSWSDERLKKNIQPLQQGLARINQLRPVSYQWRPAEERAVGKTLSLPANEPQLGFIAQEVEAVLPQATVKNQDGVYALKEAELLPVMVQAIKELSAQVADLKAQVAALKGKN